jgi:hypothetical protein
VDHRATAPVEIDARPRVNGVITKLISHRIALYVDAAHSLRARQLVHRARRAVPLPVLAAGTRARPPAHWRPLAAGLAVDRAPQSGPQDPPAASATFSFVGATRAFADDASFWQVNAEGLLLPSIYTTSPSSRAMRRASVRLRAMPSGAMSSGAG